MASETTCDWSMVNSSLWLALTLLDLKRVFFLKFECYLTLNAPIAIKVVCFSHLLKCLRSLYGKQCVSRSDCSYRSSLFWVHAVCSILSSSVMLGNILQQTTSADDIFRCNFFLGALRDNFFLASSADNLCKQIQPRLVVGWCALCCSFQRDGPVIFGLKALHLRQICVGAFSLFPFFFSISLSGRRQDMTEILLIWIQTI